MHVRLLCLHPDALLACVGHAICLRRLSACQEEEDLLLARQLQQVEAHQQQAGQRLPVAGGKSPTETRLEGSLQTVMLVGVMQASEGTSVPVWESESASEWADW